MAAEISSSRKTVEKAMRILNAFTQSRPEIRVSELSRDLAVHKSVVSRLVSELCRWQMLEQHSETRALRIGVGAFRIGSLFSTHHSLARVAAPHVAGLAERTTHSAHVSVLDGTQMLVVVSVEGSQSLRMIMRPGDRRFLHATAAGKLFLAFSDANLFEAAINAPGLLAQTDQTITQPEILREQFPRIVRERIATNRGEHTVGAGAVAAPILNERGRMIAAISTVFPMVAVSAREEDSIVRETRGAAARIMQDFAANVATAARISGHTESRKRRQS